MENTEKQNPQTPATSAQPPTPAIPPNIADLRKRLANLDALLANPQPGLMTWQIAYWRRVEQLMEFFGVKTQ